jgi:hypothetical protein
MSREIFFPSQFGSSIVFFLRTRSLSSYEDLRRPVAILPSALSVSDLRSVPVGRPRFSGCCDLNRSLVFREGRTRSRRNPAVTRTRRSSSFAFPTIRTEPGLGCVSCDLVTVPERVIDFAAHPQLVQQHRQLTRHRRNRSLLWRSCRLVRPASDPIGVNHSRARTDRECSGLLVPARFSRSCRLPC